MNFWVNIENGSGKKLGAGPLRARHFEHEKPLSSSGEFSFEVNAADPNVDILSEKRTAICQYFDAGGALKTFGSGIIDRIERSIDNHGALTLQVSGNDLGRELTYRSVENLVLQQDGAGVLDAPQQIMALAPAGWSLVGGETATAVYASYDGESVLNALVKTAASISECWRLGEGRQVIWLGDSYALPSSGVRAVQHVHDLMGFERTSGIAVISSLEDIRDAADIVTRIYPRGSGNGSAVVTLQAATESPAEGFVLDKEHNCLINQAAEESEEYGRIDRYVEFKDVGPISNTDVDVQNAANMLLVVAANYLRVHAKPVKSYKIELAGVNQLLEPGTTIRVVYRKLVDGRVIYDLDDVFNIISVTQNVDEQGLYTSAIEISTSTEIPQTDASIIADQVQNSRIYATHAQLSASVDNLNYIAEVDDNHAAYFRFWIGPEYTQIQQCLFRFRIQKFRSTVKPISAISQDTASDGGGTYQTTESSPEDPHAHNVTIPDHVHSFMPHVQTNYGIFELSSGYTLQLENMVFKLNGSDDLRSFVEDIGSGWYLLDLTMSLVNDIHRPKREKNELVISTITTNRYARIEAQLTLRGIVQAVRIE